MIVGLTPNTLIGMPIPRSFPLGGIGTADLILYVCGAIIGASGGGLYAASRSMMVRHTDPARPTEAFGLFALSGKATAFLAPAMIAAFTFMLSDTRLGYIPVILLFLLGLYLLRWVQENGDQEKWSADAIPAP